MSLKCCFYKNYTFTTGCEHYGKLTTLLNRNFVFLSFGTIKPPYTTSNSFVFFLLFFFSLFFLGGGRERGSEDGTFLIF